jgi:hypothetical protein
MVQFVGVNFLGDRVCTSVVDRKAKLLQSDTVPLPGVAPTAIEGVLEIPPQEWTRAGFLALRDAYVQLPVKHRRLWGTALAGPQGWIAIDPDLDPLSPLRLTPGRSPLPDLLRWLEDNRRLRSRIFSILSPKDFFRLRMSGGLAADVTQASLTGLLLEGERFWSPDALDDHDVDARWLPPVFASSTTTGRVSEEGVEQTGIPGGIWVVAGADSSAAAELAAGVIEPGETLVLIDGATIEIRRVLDAKDRTASTEDWQRVTTATPDRQVLMCRREVSGSDASLPEAIRAIIERAVEELTSLECAPSELVIDSRSPISLEISEELADLEPDPSLAPFAGQPDPGTAYLAGLAKGMFKNPRDLLKKMSASLDKGIDAEDAEK